ncbi:hypothetical protein GL325_15355 [Aeromicrobium sp. 636]|uniref:DUF4352 domain-containing protein n=1 Tax=Aeromicrobium senzhongii TaxID=2663859 RepID=A0A8I0EYF6_9ACTN|nr:MULTISPECIES: hypothetical protein [Aeromicrobium]MBC9227705.1 hypothetical protein [Aeromicrobium senzhongii]MCQ3999801.1 hypothetical protein [Aeromicrobium sp. 636]
MSSIGRKPVVALTVAAVAVVAVIVFTIARGGSSEGSSTASDPDRSAPTSATTTETVGAEKSAAPEKSGKKTDKAKTGRPRSTSPIPPELEPVALNEVVRASGDVQVQITKIESVQGKAKVAGEISGPAVRVTVEIENGSDGDLDLGYVSVNAYTGSDRVPAAPIMQPGGRPMVGTLKAGGRADGVYLFSVGTKARPLMTVGVDYVAGQPTAIFRGRVAG